MPKICEHNIPETLKGSGECRIVTEVKKRNGKPLWWCTTHGMDASAPDGAALESCPARWLEAVPADRRLDLDVSSGEISVWGAIHPALQIGHNPSEPGRVHVHRRPRPGAEKDIDANYDIVRLNNGPNLLEVESMAAVAYSLSELAGHTVKSMACPKANCRAVHIDELKFATHPHRKHQCNRCGRNFWDSQAPSISNPLADAHAQLGLPTPIPGRRIRRPLRLDSSQFASIALWPSNPAIVSTASRPEDIGIHVHAWDHNEQQVIDETYAPVYLDGDPLDEDHLRALAVQKNLAHDIPILNVACSQCGTAMLSPSEGWIEPATVHTCPSCHATTRTRRRVFLNPLADKGGTLGHPPS
jgi:hypothetical protein